MEWFLVGSKLIIPKASQTCWYEMFERSSFYFHELFNFCIVHEPVITIFHGNSMKWREQEKKNVQAKRIKITWVILYINFLIRIFFLCCSVWQYKHTINVHYSERKNSAKPFRIQWKCVCLNQNRKNDYNGKT